MKKNKFVAGEIKKKVSEFTRQLIDGLEKAGEWQPKMRRFYIDIALPPAENQQMVTVKAVWRTDGSVRGPTELSQDDWKYILALTWTPGQRKVMDELRRRDNQPLHSEEISALLGRDFLYGGEALFNSRFYKVRGEKGRSYSLLRVGGAKSPEGKYYRLFKMRPRPRKPKFT